MKKISAFYYPEGIYAGGTMFGNVVPADWITLPGQEKILSTSVYGSTISASEEEVRFNDIRTNVTILALEIANIKEEIKKLNINFSIQIYDLDNPNYKLESPLSVIVSKEDDYYYAESVDFDIYGTGKTEREAISELQETLIDFYENLTKEKKITKDLEAKRKLLTKLILLSK